MNHSNRPPNQRDSGFAFWGQMKGSDWRVHLVPKGQRFQRVYGQGAAVGTRNGLFLLVLIRTYWVIWWYMMTYDDIWWYIWWLYELTMSSMMFYLWSCRAHVSGIFFWSKELVSKSHPLFDDFDGGEMLVAKKLSLFRIHQRFVEVEVVSWCVFFNGKEPGKSRGVGEGMVTTMSFPDFAGKSLSDAAHAYYMCLDEKNRAWSGLDHGY